MEPATTTLMSTLAHREVRNQGNAFHSVDKLIPCLGRHRSIEHAHSSGRLDCRCGNLLDAWGIATSHNTYDGYPRREIQRKDTDWTRSKGKDTRYPRNGRDWQGEEY
jgi:hypothetical protein